jgi:hypothetical protein
MEEKNLRNITLEELNGRYSISKLTQKENGKTVQEWLKDNPEIKKMMEEKGTLAMKVWNEENRQLIQEFALKGAEGSKNAWNFLREFDPEGYKQLIGKLSQSQLKARQKEPEKFKEIDKNRAIKVSEWIKNNPEKHKEIYLLAQKSQKDKFAIELKERYETLWTNLPEGNFSMNDVKELKEKLNIKGNNKFTTNFKNAGYLIKVHTGVNGSATNTDLYIKCPNKELLGQNDIK